MIRLRSLIAGGLVATAAFAAVATPAVAASGTTTLSFAGPAAKALRESGVKIRPVKPARGSGSRLELPIAAGLAGDETTLLRQLGGIRLRARGGKQLRLTGLRLTLGDRSRLGAKLGGSTINLFRVSGRRRGIDPGAGTIALSRLRLRLTGAAARAIGDRLGTPVQKGRFGTMSVRASGLTGATPAAANTGQAPGSNGCPLPSGAGPAPEEPLPVAVRPAGAVDVTGASIDWHVRESFIRYIASGEGTSVSGGASADPPVLAPGTSTALSYDFHFPFASGWNDSGPNPLDAGDDSAAIYFGGAVRFHYSAHEIDLVASDPEIEIDGGSSRAIFSVAEGAGSPRRQVLVNLDLSRAAAVSVNGSTHTYERVPGAIPAGTATSTFAGFYAPGTEFGCFTVSYTTS